jgi:hypothetical protein
MMCAVTRQVVYRNWPTRSADEKVRAVHVLGRLTLYLLRSSVGMFVPKVFSTINSALADPQATPALRRMAYQVSALTSYQLMQLHLSITGMYVLVRCFIQSNAKQ